jgi:hypothetical protein
LPQAVVDFGRDTIAFQLLRQKEPSGSRIEALAEHGYQVGGAPPFIAGGSDVAITFLAIRESTVAPVNEPGFAADVLDKSHRPAIEVFL